MSEILLILLFGMLLFGGTRVANLGGSLGQAIRNFKKGLNGEDESPPKPQALASNAPEAKGEQSATKNG